MPTASREQAYPPALRAREDRLVEERRARAEAPGGAEGAGAAEAGPGREDRPKVGLALSGGGIRSATFSLGVLQAIARHGLLGRVDYLSTVSGGGYVGAFLGCLFQRWRSLHAAAHPTPHPAASASATTPAAAVRSLLVDPQSWPCHWLRECGRYLIPNRGSDEAILLAAFLRNWLAVQLVLLVLLLVPLTLYRLADVVVRGTAVSGASPAALFLAALVVLWLAPAGLGYWLAGPVVALVAGLATTAVGFAYAGYAGTIALPARAVPPLGLAAVALVLALLVAAYYARRYPDLAERRRYLTAGLAMGLQATAVVAVVAAVDGLGGLVREALRARAPVLTLSGLLGALGTLSALVQRIAPRLLSAGENRPHIPGQLAALLLALAIAGLEAVLLSAALHGHGARTLAAALAVLVVACALLGQSVGFLNLSTHSTIYAARLTRAYLGATNAARQRFQKPLSDPVEGDDVAFRAYAPWTGGGPLHLVNLTLNETMSGETQVEFRDRKGLNVAFGPCGVSVGARHHAGYVGPAVEASSESTLAPSRARGRARLVLERLSPPEPFQVFVPDRAGAEPFALGRLVAVSGAAFTTGLGSRTSLGLSLLLGLANVRLGYWWDSGTGPRAGHGGAWGLFERIFPVQAHLLEEMLARFYGASERLWYLSDGGHFENTAVYELVRRRLPFIVACDNGCDPAYAWTDVGNLVRKLRLDFGAQLHLLDAEEIAGTVDPALRDVIVPWSSFAAYDGGPRPRGGYATLAEVSYVDSDERTTILFVKPALRGDETADVLTYWSQHTEFPQQSTLDQFFDEDQWESYRRLGDACGSALFQQGLTAGWSPGRMEPLGARGETAAPPSAATGVEARLVPLGGADAPPTA